MALFIIPPVPENKMLLFRTRAAGVKLAGFLQSTLIETGEQYLMNVYKLLKSFNNT